MTINQRLKEYFEFEKIHVPDIYKKLGVGRTVFFGWLNQGKAIPLNKLQQIVILLPALNARWLLTGEGEMISGRKVYSENDSLLKVEENTPIVCPYCLLKNEQIKNLEMHRDDLRKQISLLEFSLGKNVQKA